VNFRENIANTRGQCYNKQCYNKIQQVFPSGGLRQGDVDMQKDLMRILSRITLISQLGLSFVTPPLLLLLLALWLQDKFGWGDWILLCAILTGCISGGCAVFNLIRAEIRRDAPKNKNSDRGGSP